MTRTIALLMIALCLSAAPRVRAQAPQSSSGSSVAPAASMAPAPFVAPQTPALPSASTAAPPAPSAAAGASAQRPAAVKRSTAAATSADRLELGTTQISGNRELPKVMYVVPWRRPDLGDTVGRPPNSLVDEVLTPVDREVFQRQNRYYGALESSAAAAKSQPGSADGHAPVATPKDEK